MSTSKPLAFSFPSYNDRMKQERENLAKGSNSNDLQPQAPQPNAPPVSSISAAPLVPSSTSVTSASARLNAALAAATISPNNSKPIVTSVNLESKIKSDMICTDNMCKRVDDDVHEIKDEVATDITPTSPNENSKIASSDIVAAAEQVKPQKKVITVEITQDTNCPYCWIGKKRLDKAMSLMKQSQPDVDFDLVYRAYQVNINKYSSFLIIYIYIYIYI